MNWNESFTQYAVDIAKLYVNNPDQVLCCMGFESVVGSLNETYQVLIKDGLTKIEDLPSETKNRLWNQSAAYAESKSKRIMICKVIHLLEELTKDEK